jgi:predicted metal-dependent peptidase
LCDIRDAQDSLPDTDVAAHRMEWGIAVGSAAEAAKKAGTLPAGMERFINMTEDVKVPWREVLARFVTQIACDDYIWTKPNKRHYPNYLPSLYSERMGKIVVVIDTSGSIDQPTLDAFGTEIRSIVHTVRPELTTVMYCDAAINHVDEFAADDDLVFKMHGGGGTSFIPPFKLIEETGEDPVALVYLTDMYGDFPEPVDYPVLWCATTDVIGPFGETLRIEV